MEPRRARELLSAFLCVCLCGLLVAEDAKEEPTEQPKEAPAEGQAGEGAGALETEKGSGPNVEGWEKYVDLLEGKYAPPADATTTGAFKLRFDLSTDVPKGTKVRFTLEYLGTDFDSVEYTLKDENRKNLSLEWSPAKKPATGDYFLRTRIILEDQTAAVQKAIKAKAKRFPMKNKPWAYLYMTEEDGLKVGGEADEASEAQKLCEIYTAFVDELVGSMNEFVDKMEVVKEGKAFVSGGKLDVEKFTEYVITWRKKQGEVQKKINEFQIQEPALFQKSQTAYINVQDLGRMVSKRAVQVQKEVTEQYKEKLINPPAHQYFSSQYRYAVTAEALERRLEVIVSLTCPEEPAEEGEGEGEGEAAPGEGAPAGAEKSAEKPAEGEGTAEKEATPEEPAPEETPEKTAPAKKGGKTTKKAPAKATKPAQ